MCFENSIVHGQGLEISQPRKASDALGGVRLDNGIVGGFLSDLRSNYERPCSSFNMRHMQKNIT